MRLNKFIYVFKIYTTMLAKIMGVIDILMAFSLILIKFNVYTKLLVILTILVALKALIFFSNFVSIVDLIGVVIVVVSIFFGANFLLILVFIWFLQKGLFSLFA